MIHIAYGMLETILIVIIRLTPILACKTSPDLP
jgi:hypothetical protein